MIIFISGGVRSGKSRAAENMVQTFCTKRAVYIATSQQTDSEMQKRIQLHQKERQAANTPWVTIEQSVDLQQIFPNLQSDDAILLDCVTNWLANELFLTEKRWQTKEGKQEVFLHMREALDKLFAQSQTVVLVSNELFEAGVLQEPTYSYMKMLGKLHQYIVEKADVAICVEAGIYRFKKGKECVDI
ncbi:MULTISPECIES: bifunctional adenosylcobinamide kinase/adenosylcobinamide-phosphate guanylyltransferase [Priestia]|uniref:bifunctional adenosylcobinamide kinase/adenosylcobinamide-phosphate guanylyltransferase n=1 Tax=Priestia TaxID=2800373 RepID=UPI002877B8B0|nr:MULTISPECIES: bifunctional adenosylcobinamide kinase/adenosylcobinamide-phosphate guanylyltransferase [Priestia]MBX4162814.1 bifunctional adenosylcobinamide kinase/adenosylcobinamide-phosphate guanylyltransferase [Priestia megaterium]MED3895678.1 bifunctional adenosylcobinamide kinase/adenosylcobinamide-phosphate guanylyltransferase [Priestia aryabhattai]